MKLGYKMRIVTTMSLITTTIDMATRAVVQPGPEVVTRHIEETILIIIKGDRVINRATIEEIGTKIIIMVPTEAIPEVGVPAPEIGPIIETISLRIGGAIAPTTMTSVHNKRI